MSSVPTSGDAADPAEPEGSRAPLRAPGPVAPGSTDAGSTRERIVASAMALFADNGYDRTTMRAVAADAGLSVGNAYYYFASKEHLIQGFYDLINSQHHELATAVISGQTAFADRLGGLLHAWVDVAKPHHAFAAQFFRHAADPRSPMSPFSEESEPTRTEAIGNMVEVVEGSDIAADPELLRRLPQLLWLYQMGIVLFWVYDPTDDASRTRLLIDRSVPLIDRLLRLSRLRVLRGVTRQTLELLDDLGWQDAGNAVHPRHTADDAGADPTDDAGDDPTDGGDDAEPPD